jgi:hypothetical protein
VTNGRSAAVLAGRNGRSGTVPAVTSGRSAAPVGVATTAAGHRAAVRREVIVGSGAAPTGWLALGAMAAPGPALSAGNVAHGALGARALSSGPVRTDVLVVRRVLVVHRVLVVRRVLDRLDGPGQTACLRSTGRAKRGVPGAQRQLRAARRSQTTSPVRSSTATYARSFARSRRSTASLSLGTW